MFPHSHLFKSEEKALLHCTFLVEVIYSAVLCTCLISTLCRFCTNPNYPPSRSQHYFHCLTAHRLLCSPNLVSALPLSSSNPSTVWGCVLPATFVSRLKLRGNASPWAHKWPILGAGWDWCLWSSCADLLSIPTGEWEITLCSAGEDKRQTGKKWRGREGDIVTELRRQRERDRCHKVDEVLRVLL